MTWDSWTINVLWVKRNIIETIQRFPYSIQIVYIQAKCLDFIIMLHLSFPNDIEVNWGMGKTVMIPSFLKIEHQQNHHNIKIRLFIYLDIKKADRIKLFVHLIEPGVSLKHVFFGKVIDRIVESLAKTNFLLNFNYLSNKSIQICICWSFYVQISSADIIYSFIIDHESTIWMF